MMICSISLASPLLVDTESAGTPGQEVRLRNWRSGVQSANCADMLGGGSPDLSSIASVKELRFLRRGGGSCCFALRCTSELLCGIFANLLEYAKPEREETKGGGGGKAESWRGTEAMKVFIVKS